MRKYVPLGLIAVVALACFTSSLRAANLLSTGFETSEGYSDGSLEQKLVTGYLGDAGNQQGWYGEDWALIGSGDFRYYNNNRGTVTDDRAHTGTQSLKIPAEDSFYRMYLHPIEEHSTGFVSIEMYVYLESVDATATANNVLLNAKDNFIGAAQVGNEWDWHAPIYGRGPSGRLYDFGNDYHTDVGPNTPDRINFYSSGATFNTINQTGAGAAGAWVGRRAVIDVVAGKASYYVNTAGSWVLGASNVEMINRTGPGPALLDEIYFYQISGPGYYQGSTFAFVDDIRVDWSEQPPVTAHPGDFDSDGDVDGADFVAWQTNFPKASNATLAQGDADADGDVDGADFVVWQTNFPFTPGPGASPVPEPSALLLLTAFGLCVSAKRFRCRWQSKNGSICK